MAACADPSRDGGWINPDVVAAYTRLHELGWAHSVETWDDRGRLVGGLYGVVDRRAVRRRVDVPPSPATPRRWRWWRWWSAWWRAGAPLLDVQWSTPHLASLGAVEVARTGYLELLARPSPSVDPFDRPRSGADGGDPGPRWQHDSARPGWDHRAMATRRRAVAPAHHDVTGPG